MSGVRIIVMKRTSYKRWIRRCFDTVIARFVYSYFWSTKSSWSKIVIKPISYDFARSDPLRTTADTLYNSSRVFPSAGSIIVTKEHYPKTAGAAPQFGLTQSTKLLQQYKKKTLQTPKSKPNSSHHSTVSTASSKSETPKEKEKENVTRKQRRESRNRQRTDKSNIPLRSQSFRWEYNWRISKLSRWKKCVWTNCVQLFYMFHLELAREKCGADGNTHLWFSVVITPITFHRYHIYT